MKKVLLLLVVVVAIVAVGALALGKGKAEMYKGYLADVAGATSATGKAADAVRRKIEERTARNAHKRSVPPLPPF